MQLDRKTLELINRLTECDLSKYEAKQLTEVEVEQINRLVSEAYRKLEIVNDLFESAKQRFAEKVLSVL